MTELWLILLAYLSNVKSAVLRRFWKKKVQMVIPEKKLLKKGDIVENKQGETGTIWRVYVQINTNEPVGCLIRWDENKSLEQISKLFPVEDRTPEFNPYIRKVTK